MVRRVCLRGGKSGQSEVTFTTNGSTVASRPRSEHVADPAASAAGQLQNKFKLCCLVHAIHYGRSPAYLNGNSSVSRRQQITLRATLIFHLIDGLLSTQVVLVYRTTCSTTAAHEVRRAGVLTCGSCHLERSARPHPHRG